MTPSHQASFLTVPQRFSFKSFGNDCATLPLNTQNNAREPYPFGISPPSFNFFSVEFLSGYFFGSPSVDLVTVNVDSDLITFLCWQATWLLPFVAF